MELAGNRRERPRVAAAMTSPAASSMPDGIDDRHLRPRRSRYISWYRALLIGGLLAAALFGFVGGQHTQPHRVSTQAAVFSVHMPDPVRNGMFVEWRIDTNARRPIGDLVVAIPANLWTDMTVNTLVPAASEEEFKDGEYRFHFGSLDAGKRLLFKIDGQVNPPRVTSEHGNIRLLDGEQELGSVPVRFRVVP
jgi:hypothetical protein